MINETLEANRAYQKDKDDAYNRGYKQGKADALPHWIPVTERLPKIGEYILCTVKPPYRGKLHVCKYVDKDNLKDHPYFDWRHNGFPDVIAWMPLPEPYKGVMEI